MEAWEQLVDTWSGDVDIAAFSRLSHTAQTVLKEDLADFEIEWISSSLLHSPVHLLKLISSHSGDSSWTKPVTDAFKLMTTLVERYPECSDQYHDDIIKICQSPLEARARGVALHCLSSRAARSLRGIRPATYLAEMEAASTCKAPLATLIGTICECHPEAVADDISRVWRAYLNLLQCNKNTEAVRTAAVRGAGRVLTCFGEDLPVAEVALLYPALATDIGDVSLQLLEKHAHLFREQLAADVGLRRRLWAAAAAPGALLVARVARVVTEAACASDPAIAQVIVERELVPLASSRVPRVRYYAARACGVRPRDVSSVADALALEFQLRTHIDDVSDYVAEAICWCVEARVPHYKVLLQTAILYHERLSPARLNDIVVQGLRSEAKQTNFNFSESALQFLVTESCRPGGVERYRALVTALCEGSEGNNVVEKLASHLANELRAHATIWDETFPPHLESLLRVCVCAFSSYKGETALRWIIPELCAMRCHQLPAPVLTLMTMLPECYDVTRLYERVDILRALDEESMCASALALLHAPLDVAHSENLLTAIQIIVSRKDAEPATISRALRLLSRLLTADKTRHKMEIAQILRLVSRLRERFLGSEKDARVLRRDLDLFLGNHGCGEECYISELDLLVAQLGDKLTITLPSDSGLDCQINLKQILKLALEQEDQDSLDVLTVVMCDHPEIRSSNPPEAMLSLLSRVLEIRAKRTARGEISTPSTPDIPALAAHLLQRICSCMSVGTRLVLCQMLRPLLRDVTLRRVAENVLNLLSSQHLLSRLGAVSATVPVMSALREDSVLASEWLLRFPPLLVETNEASSIEALKLTVDVCVDLRHVFSTSALNTVTKDLLKALLQTQVTSHTQTITYKNHIQISVNFLKKIVEDSASITDIVFRMCKRDDKSLQCLYLIAVLKKELGLDSKLLEREGWIVKALDGKRGNDFDIEAVLVFVAEFADVLLEIHYEATISVLCDVVTHLSPGSALVTQQPLRRCARAVGAPPPRLAPALLTWSDTLPFNDIAEYLQSYNFPASHVEAASAMRAVLQAWPVPHATHLFTQTRAAAVVWPRHILTLYAQTPTLMQEHKSYLLDLLWLGTRLGSSEDLSQLLLDDATIASLSFSTEFMPALYTFLLCKPFVLCKPELSACCMLLRDIAICCDQNHADQLLQLTDELWDTYTLKSDATSCAALLTTLVRVGASDKNRCVRETARRVSETELSLRDRAVLLSALPPCDVVSGAYLSFVRGLPVRLSECVGEFAAALRSVLDACASAAHAALLGWLARLAAGEDVVGWWDSAMECCMASLAVSATSETLRNLHALALLNPLSTGAVDRLLVPLVRYSPPTVCEQFFSTILPATLVSMRSAHAVADSVAYRRSVLVDTNNVTLLALMVEKVPRGSLESPSSVLHSNASSTGTAPGNALRPWHYVREACRLIVALQGKIVAPSQASSEELCSAVIKFQQRAYNALSALVCVWRADERLYTRVTDAAFHTLVETDTYALPLRALPSHRTLIAAGGEKANEGGIEGGTRTLGTTTQRVFLRTLTENPYCFDLHDQNEETEHIEMIVSDSALNRHPCAGAITALLKHLAGPGGPKPKGPVTTGQAQGPKSTQFTDVGKGPVSSTNELGGPSTGAPVTPDWLKAFCKALCDTNQNVRWLLSQSIVNARSEIRELASCLSPALLAVVSDTGGNALNSLHVDILETVAWWYTTNSATPPASPQTTPPLHVLSACANVLMRTCIDVHERKGVHYALLNTISSFLKEFPDVMVEWDIFRRYLDGNDRACLSACVRVLTRASRAGVYVAELAPTILAVMDNNQTHIQLTDLAKLFSLATPTIPGASEKARVCEQYSSIAMRVRRDNITNYINMLYYGHCTALEHFKHVADTAAKVRPVRDKCVSVLAASLRANMLGERARDLRDQLPADLRADVMRGCADVAFDELFPSSSSSSPIAKRARTDQIRSVLVATRGSERALAHILHSLSHTQRREKLDEKMAEDLATRLVECFYACVYLPCKYPPSPLTPMSEGGRLFSLMTLLLSRVRSQPRYMRTTLPRPSVARLCGVLTAACGTRAGTLRTQTSPALTRATRTRGWTLPVAVVKEDSTEDAPIPLDKALDTFLKFGECCWEAGCSILSSLCRASLRGEQASMLADMLADTLAIAPAPSLLRFAVELMPVLADISPFEATVGKLSQQWACTEAASELRILQDELRLRTPPHPALQPLGLSISNYDVMSALSEERDFSIEALVTSFGRLSEWSQKPLRERRRREADLPLLWTTLERFRQLLHSYASEGDDWFSQCVRIRRGSSDVTRTLRAAARWPRNKFHVSAVAETIELSKGSDVTSVPDINDDSCLVEWAARLQLRASGTGYHDRALSRSHALAWSKVALERHLPKLALQCIRIYIDEGDVLESEVLSWINLRARALRTLGRGEGDGGEEQHHLRKALHAAESGLQFVEVSNARDVLELCLLLVQLHMDLETLTDNIVQEALSIARTARERDSNISCDKDGTSTKEGDSMRELSETAILHYDDTWDARDPDTSLTLICDVLERCASETGIAVVLNRLAKEKVGQKIGEKASDLLLDILLPIIPSLPDHFATRLVHCLPTLLATSLHKHKDGIDKLTDRSLDKWRRCLQLLCGAEQTLLTHCEALQKALQAADAAQWRSVFARMRSEVFENELAGADYRALHTHKQTLYDLEHTGEEMCSSSIAICQTTLVSVMEVLGRSTRARRSVAALCPALAASHCDVTEALADILHLDRGQVLGLEDEMYVFTDSICSPGVLCVRLRDSRRRYLVKRERVALSSCFAAAAVALATSVTPQLPPQVIVLSEDCGLVEFLEGHERVRDLIQGEVNLSGIAIKRQAQRNEELILAPQHVCLKSFGDIVQQVPPAAFRRAFFHRCSDTRHFLSSQRMYTSSLCTTGVLTWLLGLGDRHLNNVLTSPSAGAVCAVDCGALFHRELVPARLTHMLTSILPEGVLEATLQQTLQMLRDERRRVMPLLTLAVHGSLPEFAHQVEVIEQLISGKLSPHEATIQALGDQAPHAARLLREMFHHVQRTTRASIEQQVSCLLLQSTSPRVLSVIRSEWEPWL